MSWPEAFAQTAPSIAGAAIMITFFICFLRS
jgi:hypothetical protein